MKINFEEIRRKINKIKPENMERQGVITPAKTKANGYPTYICPFCGNGEGKSGDGLAVKEYDWGFGYTCFSGCGGKTYNNLQLLSHYHGINDGGKDSMELLKHACNDFGIYFPGEDNQKYKKNTKKHTAQPTKTAEKLAQEQEQKEQSLIVEDIKKARANFAKLPLEEKRGLTDETLNKFQVGADLNWTPPNNRLNENKEAFQSPRVIIPHLQNSALPEFKLSYCAALFLSDRKDTYKYKYLYVGRRIPLGLHILTLDAEIILITEGEFDAMSIYQATGGKYPCLATGGTAFNDVFEALSKFYPKNKPQIIFVADNDDAGKNFANKFFDVAREKNFIAISIFFADFNDQKLDANKILVEKGNDKLADIINEKIALAQIEFERIAAKIEKESALKEKITDWTKRNGKIENLDRIKSAADYLQSFTVDKITSTVATESKTIQALAICKYYDFYHQVTDDFLARVLSVKDAAKQKVKTSTTENPVADSARMMARIEIKEISDAIKKAVTAVEKNHLKYQQTQEQLRLQEEYQRRKQETQIKNQDLLERLKELQKEDSSPARNAEMQEIILELCEWNYNKSGKKISVKSSMANYDLIFTYDPFIKELFGYEEFSQSDVFLKTPLWNKSQRFEKWTDSDDSNLRVYLRRTYKDIVGEQLYYDVFKAYSVQNSFNVVQNYFNNLPNWDGKARAETLFIDFLKVEDTPFARAVTEKWLLAAVARIFYPGCNFQAALVLQGNQNIGKSYILEKLGGAWYGALIDNVDDSHAVDAIKNLWIVELKEMAAARKAEINAVKSFIERSADNHRAAYEKRVQTFKRHCVFAVSVNDEQFLRDLTGNRRYWILESPLAEFNYIEGLTPEYIQQIWAEVFYKFKELTKEGFNDKILELPLELKIQAENIAEKFTADDGLQREITAFLDIPILPPVLWKLLTKEERRVFHTKGFVELDHGDWMTRCEMLKSDKEKQEFDKAIDEENKTVRCIEKKFGNDSALSIAVYGSYTRQETCAAEIYNEFYSVNDKRKQIYRINEVLAKLENWKLTNEQSKNFNGYGNQKKIYRRIANTDEKEKIEDNFETHAQDSNYFVKEADLPF